MVSDNMDWDERRGPEHRWTDEERDLLGLVIVRMIEIDPTFRQLERVLEKALLLVRRLGEGPREEEN